jgi:acyl carrier protein
LLSKDDIHKQLVEIMKQDFQLTDEQLLLSAHLVDDLDLDSIDAIDLAVRLEETLGLQLQEDELKAIRTMQDIVDTVFERLQSAPA